MEPWTIALIAILSPILYWNICYGIGSYAHYVWREQKYGLFSALYFPISHHKEELGREVEYGDVPVPSENDYYNKVAFFFMPWHLVVSVVMATFYLFCISYYFGKVVSHFSKPKPWKSSSKENLYKGMKVAQKLADDYKNAFQRLEKNLSDERKAKPPVVTTVVEAKKQQKKEPAPQENKDNKYNLLEID